MKNKNIKKNQINGKKINKMLKKIKNNLLNHNLLRKTHIQNY